MSGIVLQLATKAEGPAALPPAAETHSVRPDAKCPIPRPSRVKLRLVGLLTAAASLPSAQGGPHIELRVLTGKHAGQAFRKPARAPVRSHCERQRAL